VYIAESENHTTAFLKWTDKTGDDIALRTIQGRAGWISACSNMDIDWLVHGTPSAFAVTRMDEERVAKQGAPVELGIPPPFNEDNPDLDGIKVLCTGQDLFLVLLDREDGDLYAVSCDSSAHCNRPQKLAQEVYSFDAAVFQKRIIIAYGGEGNQAQIRVLSLDREAKPIEPVQTPAVCWNSAEGMCGVPTLAASDKRLLLGAMDRGNLLVIESTDLKQKWQTMSGLRVTTAPPIDRRSILQAHRKRTE